MILNDMIFRDHIIQFTPCSLGSVLGNTALGTALLDSLPGATMRNTSSREISRSEGDVFPSASFLLAVYGYITLTACFICFAFYRISSHYKFCIELKQPCTVHRGDGSPIVALGGFCFVSIAPYYGVNQYTLQYNVTV